MIFALIMICTVHPHCMRHNRSWRYFEFVGAGGKYAEWRTGSRRSGLLSSAGQRPKLFLPAPKSGHSGLSGRPVPASRCCHFLVQWPLDRGLPMASASTQTQPPPSAPATGTFSFYGYLFLHFLFFINLLCQGSTST